MKNLECIGSELKFQRKPSSEDVGKLNPIQL